LRSFTKALSRSSRNENIYQQKLQVARLEEEEKSLKQQLDEVSRKLETFSSLEKPTTVQAGEASSLVSEISSLQQNLRQLRVQIQSLGTESKELKSD
jgi:predicted  nucleic acid-binding Zn-ribbon protein